MAKTALDLLAEDEARTGRILAESGRQPRRMEQRGGLDNLSGVSDFGNPQSWLLTFLGLPSKSGAAVSHVTAMNVSVVYRCVTLLANIIGTLPLRLYQRTAGNSREEARAHPLWDLMTVSPDGFHSDFEFRQFMQGCLSLRGNAYALLTRDRHFAVTNIEAVRPDFITIWPQADGTAIYRFKGKNYPWYNVLHLRGLTSNGYLGNSPITMLREPIGLAMTTEEHASRFFANGAAPGGILTSPKSLGDKQLADLRAEWDMQHRGVGSTNRPMIAYGGLDWKQISIDPEDAQLLQARKFQIEEIARAFGVPLVLLGSTEKATSWGTGIEQFNRGFIDYTLAPLAKGWEKSLDLLLLSREERAAGFYFGFDFRALMRGDAAARAAFYTAMRNIGAMSVNEIRAEEHMNDLPDEIGDNYRLPFNGVGGAAPAQPEEAKVGAQDEPDDDDD